MLLETHMKLWLTDQDFLNKKFLPKNWESKPKIEFFNLLKNLVINFY